MKITPLEGKKLIKLLGLIGYAPVRQKGSHVILENHETKKTVDPKNNQVRACLGSECPGKP